MLEYFTFGNASDTPPILIAHGLFGSARNWGVLAKRLSVDRQIITVDMRNHAGSFWSETHNYQDLAEDLRKVIDRPMDVLGHSMGGKAAMVLATAQPALVNRLIVADIAPIAYKHSQNHLIDALDLVDLTNFETRGEVSTALEHAIPEDGVRAFLLQSLDIKEKRWRLNLKTLRRDMPQIIGFPEVSGEYDGPTLFLSGATSDYVLPEHRSKIKTLFPKAKFAKIPGAGHWLHAEKPREFEAAARMFFAI